MNSGTSKALPAAILILTLLLLPQLVAVSGSVAGTNAKDNSNSSHNLASVNLTKSGLPAGSKAINGGPKIVQTDNYNYRISLREVTTALAYIYTTPAGNYSFSNQFPFEMSYTSLWGTFLATG
jgi:hypothetical protein